MTKKTIALHTLRIGMGLFYMFAGLNHFWHTPLYVKIMPPYLPYPLQLVYLSGLFEMLLGLLLCTSRFYQLAAWGIIALLLGVFPANIYMAQHPQLFSTIPPLLLYIRLPFQAVLLYAAYIYTRPRRS